MAASESAVPPQENPPSLAQPSPPMPVNTSKTKVNGRTVLVSLPAGYGQSSGSGMNRVYNVLYVLDAGQTVFSLCAQAARESHAATLNQSGRQWHPELIVVALSEAPSRGGEHALLDFLTTDVVPHVDSKYHTNPYAAGRAVLGHDALGAGAMRRLLIGDENADRRKAFRFYLLGGGGGGIATPAPSAASESELPPKTAVYLSASTDAGAATAARDFEGALVKRASMGATQVSMFVNRDGEQTYTRKEVDSGGKPITLELLEGPANSDAARAAFATRALDWLGLRLERQKLESLGSLMPWHEFK